MAGEQPDEEARPADILARFIYSWAMSAPYWDQETFKSVFNVA